MLLGAAPLICEYSTVDLGRNSSFQASHSFFVCAPGGDFSAVVFAPVLAVVSHLLHGNKVQGTVELTVPGP